MNLIPALLLFVFLPFAKDISMSGLKINGAEASLKGIGLKEVEHGDDMHKYRTANGNDLSVTIEDGKIVYIENDWLHQPGGVKPLITDFEFGKTSLKDIRAKFGCNGFAYEQRMFVKTETHLVLFNCFELDSPNGEVLVTITRISLKSKVTEDNIADLAKLDALILARKSYLDVIFGGEKKYDPSNKKVKL